MYHWLVFVQVFTLVVAILMIGVGVQEYRRWKRESEE